MGLSHQIKTELLSSLLSGLLHCFFPASVCLSSCVVFNMHQPAICLGECRSRPGSCPFMSGCWASVPRIDFHGESASPSLPTCSLTGFMKDTKHSPPPSLWADLFHRATCLSQFELGYCAVFPCQERWRLSSGCSDDCLDWVPTIVSLGASYSFLK